MPKGRVNIMVNMTYIGKAGSVIMVMVNMAT